MLHGFMGKGVNRARAEKGMRKGDGGGRREDGDLADPLHPSIILGLGTSTYRIQCTLY